MQKMLEMQKFWSISMKHIDMKVWGITDSAGVICTIVKVTTEATGMYKLFFC